MRRLALDNRGHATGRRRASRPPVAAQPPSRASSDRRLARLPFAQRSFGERRSLSTGGPASIRPAIRSQVSAMASRSGRPFSAETVRALSRHLAASRRYSSGLFLVMGSCRRAGPYNTCLASPRVRQAQTKLSQCLQTRLQSFPRLFAPPDVGRRIRDGDKIQHASTSERSATEWRNRRKCQMARSVPLRVGPTTLQLHYGLKS